MDAATAAGSTRKKREASSLVRSSEQCRHRFRLGDPTGDASEAAAISDSDAPQNSPRVTHAIQRRYVAAVWAITIVAVLVRLPAVIHQSGGQDEDYFTVAGWSLLQNGVPRIPYTPSLNIHGVFYKANEVLYSLPPGFFAAEAVVFRIVGPSFAAGRLTSLLGGAAAIIGVFWLTKRWFGASSALFAATLFAFSRPFLFPATTARPDMLCTAFLIWGLVVLLASGGRESPGAAADTRTDQGIDIPRSPWRTLLSGLLIGFALLTHPFALLGLLLGIGWILFTPSDRKRLHLLLFIAGAAAIFALWLPLIAKDPALFRAQFGNNVLQRAGPGLLARLFWPWETLAYHVRLFTELAGSWQAALFGTSLIAATILELCSNRRRGGWLAAMWFSVLGLAILQGVHPSKGYWSFPAVFLCMATARVVEAFGRWKPAAILVCLALLVPGGGWKAVGVYLRHWGDPDYSHPEAVQRLFDELPAKARYLVDVGCVFDVYLSGRRTLLALDLPQYYSSAGEPFDFLIVTRTGREQNLPQRLGASKCILTFGKPDDELAVYIEVWKR
jgi:4-amino-4-deoxy-L-arabinose transferase-like glycosyltransferase